MGLSSALGRRWPARLALRLLPLGALAGVGCVTERLPTTAPVVYVDGKAQAPAAAAAEPEPSEDKPQPPKASSFVAYGDWLRSCGEKALAASRKTDRDDYRRALQTQASEQFAAARARYEHALKIEPNELGAHLGLGRLALDEGQHAAAGERFARALRLQPNSSLVHFEIGMLHARNKDWDRALANLKRAHELEPTNPTISNNYGWTLARAQRFEESWNVFRPLVGEGQAYYRLALMTRHLERPDLTKAYLTYAVQRDPNLTPAREMLAAMNPPPATIITPGAARPTSEPTVVVPATYLQKQ